MKRREFLGLGLVASAGAMTLNSLVPGQAFGADTKKVGDTKKITDKDILKDGMPATIANYCEHPDKQPNKACPGWKDKPGHCKECQFYNRDNTETAFKGKKYAHCQLLTDATKPQYVNENGWCNTFVKKIS